MIMTGREYFILGSTFFMGMFAGAYLYVSVFAPSYDAGIQTGENITAETFVIDGEMYGGCSRLDACGSFRLINGREYSFIPQSGAAIEKGKIPSKLRAALLEALDLQTLELDARPVSLDSCSAYIDGNDYTYEVSKDEETYVLDTCQSAFAYNTEVQELFLEIWYVMENPSTVENEQFEFNPLDIFWERFRQSKPE